ncbi:MAG: diguanylate cyclase, partial [Tardiphaga sp.]|nr:diguanylate cyclase [Tardiphaga sp.]
MKNRLWGQKADGVRATSEIQAAMRRGSVRWLVVVGVLLVTAIAVGTAMTVDNFRQRALDNSKRELENTVLLLTRHFDQQFQDLQRIQKSLTAYLLANGVVSPASFATNMASYESHVMLKSKIDEEFAGDLTVLDADGNLINWSSSWPPPDLKLADREYFQAMKSQLLNPDDEVVQPVFSRITGRWKTLFARRISGQKGEFLGVVTRGIEPAHLEKFFASVMLGNNATIAMFHRDGTLLARYPSAGALIGSNMSSGVLMQHLRFSDEPMTLRTVSPVDGLDRVGSIRLLRDFPLALIATATVEGVLADWRTQTKFLVATASVSALIVAGLLFLIIRHIRRQSHAAQAQLTLEKNRLDTAIDNMTQGLLLFDAQACVVICNQRYIDMYGLSREVIKPGQPFREVIAHRKA